MILKLKKDQIAVNEAGKIFMSETGKNYRNDEKDFIDFLKEKTNV